MDQAFSDAGVASKDLAISTIYFLDLLAPYLSHALLRSKFTPILTKLSPIFTSSDIDAPLLRSSIGILEILLIVQDTGAWTVSVLEASPKRCLKGLLGLAQDPRPKVRKRAQEAVTNILSNPPAGPSLEHPAGALCAEAALFDVAQQQNEAQTKVKGSKTNPGESHNAKLIHALQLVRAITAANGWPRAMLDDLCKVLLSISKTSEQYLVVAAFDVLEVIFKSISDEDDKPKLLETLKSIFDLHPSVNDQHLVPSWLAVVAQANESYANMIPLDAFADLPETFKIVVQYLDSESNSIHVSATQCLVALCSTVITPQVLLLAADSNSSKKQFQTTEKILKELSDIVFGLLNVKYQASWKEVMTVLVAMFDQLRWRSDPHLVNCFKVVATLRSDESLSDGRQETDLVIASAIRNLGPERVLELFPLNLSGNTPSQPGRAWLLPLLRDNVQFANLKYFSTDLVHLAGKLEVEINSVDDKTNVTQAVAMKIKIYETLIDQIWSTLPRFCDLPFNLQEGFDTEFAELLLNVLYKYVELRSYVCQGLRLLVESNKELSEGAVDDDILLMQRFSKEDAKKNLEHLSTFAPNLLSGLFNVFSKTPSEARGYILESITALFGVTSKTDIEATFNKVATVLHSSLAEEAKIKAASSGKKPKEDVPPTSTTMMDLIIPMTTYLPKSSHNALLSIFVILSGDGVAPMLQKKACRVISKLLDTEEGTATVIENLENIEQVFLKSSDKVSAPARGARLAALSKIVSILPQEHLYFIPSILSETVLCTKDINEKTREAAFNLLVQMGNTMKKGGVIDHAKVAGMDSDAPKVVATLEEYFTMLSAGLGGTTPHMISATVTALSRVVFEFREDIEMSMLQELASTVELFLTSQNREVVKSTLGFVKITATILPEDIVRPSLKSLVEKLLVWSHEHNSHFKSKVKHIIERLIRRFGFKTIEEVFPEGDMKLLTNIRKSKERARRNKKAGEEEANGEQAPTENLRNRKHQHPSASSEKYTNEFDRAIYGSSSEDEDSDDEMQDVNNPKKRTDSSNSRGNNGSSKYIVEGDEPLDLLDRQTLAHISSSKPSARGKQAHSIKESSRFKRGKDGKLVIKDPEAQGDGDEEDPIAKLTSGIDAYVDAIKNGPVRGQRNKLKYKRSGNNRDEDDGGGDDDGGDVPVSGNKKLGPKKNSGTGNRGFKGGAAGKKKEQPKRRFYK